ncbi:MAG: MarR family transcriptional regulator [Bacteroidota bacterium]
MVQEQAEVQLATDLRMVITRLIKKLRNKSVTGEKLSLTERSTIALLDLHKELSPSDIAAMEKITTQSMSQILNHLLELGYIYRRISKTDKRKAIISLSAAGRDTLYKVRNERDEWLKTALKETCSDKDLDLLRRALIPLTRLIDFD